MNNHFAAAPRRSLILWLYTCCALIFAMAVIGAVTRLTESGLSITEWRPLSGAVPPLSGAAWGRAYDLYRASPEFSAKHAWMGLADFKRIYFWEWLHRLVGRLIGVVYAGPLIYFAARRQIPRGYGWKLLGILALGFCQGLLGWWMVESGLVDRPSVSHFRLAAHLGLALLIYSCIWWTALSLPLPTGEEGAHAQHGKVRDFRIKPILLLLTSLTLPAAPGPSLSRRERGCGWLALLLLVVTMSYGAFTAGLHAGLLYNTFPLMGGRFMPPESFDMLREPAWVQFVHRWLAVTTGVVIFTYAWGARDAALAVMVVIQIGLGISTLLSGVWLPVAALHQAGAIILLTLLLRRLQFQMQAGGRVRDRQLPSSPA